MSFIYSQKTALLVKQPTISLLLYGREGIGKTYFAKQFPKPFFINTDRNLRYLMQNKTEEDDFDGVIVTQWVVPETASDEDKSTGFVNVVNELAANKCFGHKTIVIDLAEQVYDFCLKHVCAVNQVDHPSESRKLWAILYDTFVMTINKLRACDVNLILLTHEVESTEKDAIGREITCYWPALQEKVMRRLSGSGYVLRCYWKQQINGSVVESVRMLSLEPKPNEVHVTRFVSADGKPIALNDIELSYEKFQGIFDAINSGQLTSGFKVIDANKQLLAGKSGVAAAVKEIVKPVTLLPKPQKPGTVAAQPAPVNQQTTDTATNAMPPLQATIPPTQVKATNVMPADVVNTTATLNIAPVMQQTTATQVKPVETVQQAVKPAVAVEQIITQDVTPATPLSKEEELRLRAKNVREAILARKNGAK